MPSVGGTGERKIPKGAVLFAGAKMLEKAILCVMGINGAVKAADGQVKSLTVVATQ